ncbi:MAG: LLM class flavin-dependent oxidoreductase [Burkholderiaceae bacterium]|nr:LLM class flavin-dependent oxidoreductase [Burkholderiaceae bacterium]
MVSTSPDAHASIRASQIGVASDGRATLAEFVEQARVAEAGGASTIWVACHLFLRDPVTAAHAALAATSRIKVALMAMSPFSVHPVYIAMAAAALDELFPGRVVLCLGVGAPGDLAAAGIEAPRPLVTLREAIRVCRALLAGETMAHAGEVFNVQGRRLPNPTTRVPIVLAASGPQMLELAGAEADGVLISAATGTPFIRWCLQQVDQGEARRTAPGRCSRTAIVYTRIAGTQAEALGSIRRTMGFILRGPHHAKNVELSGTRLDQTAVWNAFRDEDWPTLERLVTDDVIRAHAAAGTPQQVRARYAEYMALGLDEVTIGGIDDRAGIGEALAVVR